METNQHRTLMLIFLGVGALLAACTPATPVEEIPPAQEVAPTEEASPAEEAEPTDVPAFTIQADPELQPALAALYSAIYEHQPAFVDKDADLLATTDGAVMAEVYEGMPTYFLPGAALAPSSDHPDAIAFVAFAASPDGQQVLIDEGLLPEVITLTDQAGNTVEIPQPVRRVVSAHGPSTFLIYGVGAEDSLVVASYLGARDPDGEAAINRIDPRYPEVGAYQVNQSEANIEEIAALEPDLIITSARTQWLDAAAELGIPTFLFEAETPERLREAMLLTGQIFGPNASAQAEAWVAYYDSIFEAVTAQTASLAEDERPRVLFTGTEPLRVASGEMYQTAIIEAAGGVSASAELVGYWNDVNLEQVVLWSPDVILVPPYGGASVEAITESPEWQALDAVQTGRVYRMPKLVAPWDTPAPDSVLGIVWTAQRLYPDLVDLDCATETEYFYRTFYDYDISAEEVDGLCGAD